MNDPRKFVFEFKWAVNLKHISEDANLMGNYAIFFLADYDPKLLSKKHKLNKAHGEMKSS